MTIIGTRREIDVIRHTCDGRCADGEWCIFGFQKNVCPVDCEGNCLVIVVSKDRRTDKEFSILNER